MDTMSNTVAVDPAHSEIAAIEIGQSGGETIPAGQESDLSAIFRRHYSNKVQMSAPQIEAIAAAIRSRGPNCNMLVFGLGNDSPLWAALNSAGYTLFLEDVQEWITNMLSIHPTLNVEQVSYAGTTVASALQSPNETIGSAQVPLFLLERKWDVIVVDGPMGYAPGLPGRALPLCWTRQISQTSTHIFVDDYDRKLEKSYADFLFQHLGASRVVLPRPATSDVSASAMLWLIGCSDPLLGK